MDAPVTDLPVSRVPPTVFLSHFCEVHGPVILLCTQATDLCKKCKGGILGETDSFETSLAVAEEGAGEEGMKTLEGRKSVRWERRDEGSTVGKDSPVCCASIGNVRYVTRMAEEGVYVSARQAPQELYGRLRRCCLRSLSVEVSAGSDGAVLFEDGEGGYALSVVFRLTDVRSRGCKRLLSLVFVDSCRDVLLVHWDAIVAQLQRIAAEWQSRAQRRYLREKQGTEGSRAVSQAHRQGRFGRSLVPFDPEPATARSPAVTSPLRSLAELFGIRGCGLWSKLHSSFSYLLWSFHQGAVVFRTLPLNPTVEVGYGSVLEFGRVLRAFPPMALRVILYNVIVGNQVVVRCQHPAVREGVIGWLQRFVPEQCRRVCVFSRQYCDMWQCNLLGLSLEAQLPRHVRSPDYVVLDILCPGCQRPQDVEYGLFWGTGNPSSSATASVAGMELPSLPGPEADSYFDHGSDAGEVANVLPVLRRRPGRKVERCSFDIFLSDSVADGEAVDHSFLVSGSGWNTVLGSALAKICLASLPREAESRAIEGVQTCWLANACAFFHLTRLPGDDPRRVHSFLKSLECGWADLGVLRYWSTGLKHQRQATTH